MNIYIRPYIAVTVLLVIFSCSKKMMGTTQPQSTTPTANMTFLALGDSYTIGQSVEPMFRFPVQTTALLRNLSINFSEADIIATTGWTTNDLLNAIAAAPPKKDYSVVTLLIGVNNQYQGKSIEEYKTQFRQLLMQSIEYAAGNRKHVFVLSIPDYSVTPFAAGRDRAKIAAEIDAFNAANKNISIELGVNYLDITGISRENDPELIASDGLHPSSKQYGRWAALLAPLIQSKL
ncbi:SGNH/GDSL hydrolase family protein [soil metagenome]